MLVGAWAPLAEPTPGFAIAGSRNSCTIGNSIRSPGSSRLESAAGRCSRACWELAWSPPRRPPQLETSRRRVEATPVPVARVPNRRADPVSVSGPERLARMTGRAIAARRSAFRPGRMRTIRPAHRWTRRPSSIGQLGNRDAGRIRTNSLTIRSHTDGRSTIRRFDALVRHRTKQESTFEGLARPWGCHDRWSRAEWARRRGPARLWRTGQSARFRRADLR